MTGPIPELHGALTGGSSLALADRVSGLLADAGVPSVAVVWDFADTEQGLAHGARWVRFLGDEPYYLGDGLWAYLTGDGEWPDEPESVGPPLDVRVGSPVAGTVSSFLVA